METTPLTLYTALSKNAERRQSCTDQNYHEDGPCEAPDERVMDRKPAEVGVSVTLGVETYCQTCRFRKGNKFTVETQLKYHIFLFERLQRKQADSVFSFFPSFSSYFCNVIICHEYGCFYRSSSYWVTKQASSSASIIHFPTEISASSDETSPSTKTCLQLLLQLWAECVCVCLGISPRALVSPVIIAGMPQPMA